MINLTEIKETIQQTNLETARRTFASGTKVSLSGTIAKVIKGAKVKLLIESKMRVFAEFPNADFLLLIGKGKTIELSGTLQSFGFDALCLNGCRITKIL